MQRADRRIGRWLAPVFSLFIVAALPAQSLKGRWTGVIDAGVDLTGDLPVVVKREALVLDLDVRGDSVVGTADRGGRWRAAVRGTFDGARVELRAAALEKDFYAYGRLVVDTVRYTWRGTLDRGELRGAMVTDPTHPGMPPLSWEARRP